MTTIIYCSIAILVGILFGWIVFSGSKSDSANSGAASNQQINELNNQLASREKEVEDLKSKLYMAENNQGKDDIKKLKALLNERQNTISQLQKRCEKLTAEAQNVSNEVKTKFVNTGDSSSKEAIASHLAEIEKLNKRIKSLEDENEEFEEDLEDAKKKIKAKDSECNSLKENIDALNRQSKQLKEEIENTKAALLDKTQLLEAKNKSLDFVREILCAPLVNNAPIVRLYKSVENVSDYIQNDVKECLTPLYSFSKEDMDNLFGSGLSRWAITAKKTWIQGKTSIAFVGEFSAGKTSIVNRILSQDNPNIPLLPVSTKATTAIPTYISGGSGTFYQFVTPNHELKMISEETFKRVDKGVLENIKGVSSLIQYFVMTYKNPNLNNLSILDTPGFNSNDKEDAQRTISVINECDALFWVFDVNAGTINRSSISLIKEHLQKPLFVVINKVDTKANSEVDKVENLIRKTLSDAGLKIQGFIRFSSNAPLSNIMTPIKSVKHDSSKDNYISEMIQLLEGMTKQAEKSVLEAKKKADNLLNESNQLVDMYDNAISSLNDACEEVANIPQFNEHSWNPFKDANYEMSISDAQRMGTLLEQIANDHCNALCNLYNKQMEKRGEVENAYNHHGEVRDSWQRLNACTESLKRKVKDLNQ